MVERETGKTLKCIHTDNDSKYIRLFKEYYKSHDIRHEQTVPKTRYNSVTERMNRTIVERIKCMLSQVKLLKSF